jgi:glycosyltransferase involved in cell wall biosynthesis
VIVPYRNAERHIGALLRGLASQQTRGLGDVEFLFVDNCSDDRGPRLVAEAAIPGTHMLVEQKAGVSAVRNRGLSSARGDVVALIDSDCVPSRAWLRELVAPFADASVQLAAGGLASYPPRTAAQRFAARSGMNDGQRSLLMALPFANGRNMAVRRTSAESVHGWPEDMDQGDDIEFSTRIVTRFACEIEYRERALVYHQDRESDEELLAQARNYGRGVAMVYARHPERLPWGFRQRVARGRRSFARRSEAAWANVARVARLRPPRDVEFARYAVDWDRSFWRGFHDERRHGGDERGRGGLASA